MSSTFTTIIFLAILVTLTVIFHWNKYSKVIEYEYGEYGNTAAALVSGKGVSNVFNWQIETGPTAWCPIGYVSLYALVFYFLGIKTVSTFWFFLMLRCVLLTIVLFLLLRIQNWQKGYNIILLAIMLVFCSFLVEYSFTDVTLNIFLSVLLIYNCVQMSYQRESRVLSILLAVILPLCNIGLAVGYFIVLIWYYSKKNYQHKVSYISSLSVIVLSFVIWGARNKMELGRFIPYKSNMWFEFYMSNVSINDGLLNRTDLIKHHPLTNTAAFKEYQNMGELNFINQFEVVGKDYIKTEPSKFIRNIINRGVNSFLYLTDHGDKITVDTTKLLSSDYYQLSQAGLIVDNSWMTHELTDQDVIQKLNNLNIQNKEAVLQLIFESKKKINKNKFFLDTPKGFIRSLLISTIPTILIILSLAVSEIRSSRIFKITIFLFLVNLAPYILISHYVRYQLFQIGFFLTFASLYLHYLYKNFKITDNRKIVNSIE